MVTLSRVTPGAGARDVRTMTKGPPETGGPLNVAMSYQSLESLGLCLGTHLELLAEERTKERNHHAEHAEHDVGDE